MTRLFQRSVRLIAGDLLVDNLRVQFRVKKTLSKEPNECEAVLYNLSESSRSRLQAKGARLILEAGYGAERAQIFSGDARQIDHVHDGANWLTKLQCGDGERAYRYERVNESFRAGTSRSAVFRRLAEATGLDIREALVTAAERLTDQFTQGYAALGRVSSELDRVLKGTGLEWSIQDGRLQALPEGGVTKDAAVALSADTGLIGSPAYGTPQTTRGRRTLRLKSLLQSALRPGGKVRLVSDTAKGYFRVLEVVHAGDTHGADFYSEVEAVPL